MTKVWLITGSSRGLGRALAEAVTAGPRGTPGYISAPSHGPGWPLSAGSMPLTCQDHLVSACRQSFTMAVRAGWSAW
jgi:hypothetical protein